jgi:hypothetical protein
MVQKKLCVVDGMDRHILLIIPEMLSGTSLKKMSLHSQQVTSNYYQNLLNCKIIILDVSVLGFPFPVTRDK